MINKKIIITSNTSWNIYNFRSELIDDLIKKEFQVVVVSPIDKFTALLKKKNIKFIDIDIKRKKLSFFNNIKTFIKYNKIIKQEKPNIIIAYTIKPNIFVNLSSFFYSNIKIINVITGLGTFYFKNFILFYFVLFLYKFSFRKSYKVIFQNKSDLNFFVKKNIINKNKSILISGSGIDTSNYNMDMPKLNKNQNYNFLMISRIVKEKGISEFLEAVNLIKNKYPKVTFILVGKIEDDFFQSKLNHYSKKNLIKYYNFTDNIKQFIKISDCVILPSYREGLSRSLLEAASCSRPIITTDVPGCNDIVEDYKNGLLCLPKNSKSLALKINEFINLPYITKKNMASNNRKKAILNYDVKTINNNIIKLL